MMKEQLTIVKVGGNIIDDVGMLNDFIQIFSGINGRKLLVHGGGKIATKTASSLGIETKMIEGRRITGDDMIDVAVMTYAGLVNKKMVALLFKEGIQAIGLTGADGNAILASKRPVKNGIDYGWVGDVEEVNGSFLYSLLQGGTTPVFCALTHDGDGQMLNTNADTIANEVALALANFYDVTLNYCFELPGVMKDINDPGSLIKEMDLNAYQKLKSEGAIVGGMIPKLDNAFAAISQGVSRVNILNATSLAQLDNVNYHEYTTLH